MKTMKIPQPPAPPEENVVPHMPDNRPPESEDDLLTGEQILADAAAHIPPDPGYVYPIDPARPGDEYPDWDTFRFPTPPPSWARRKASVLGSSDVLPPVAPPVSVPEDAWGSAPGLPASLLVESLGTSAPVQSFSKEKLRTDGAVSGGSTTVPPGPLAPSPDQMARQNRAPTEGLHEDRNFEDRAPRWAAPVQMVTSWHLDLGRMVLVHPGRRQKIDLSRVVSRTKLVGLCGLMKKEPNPEDFWRLWMGIDQACQLAFGMSLPDTLASNMDILSWPGDDWE